MSKNQHAQLFLMRKKLIPMAISASICSLPFFNSYSEHKSPVATYGSNFCK